MFPRSYPILNLSLLRQHLSADDFALVQAIVKRDGTLRASKPEKACGEAKYLWRMVAFAISPEPRHHCMPMMAFCDLPGRYGSDEYRAAEARCSAIEKVVVAATPKSQQHGVQRWASAFGY
jgi:hypothetical protein